MHSSKTKLYPISLFTYNRAEETKKVIEALQNNYLAAASDLYIFSDGPKKETDIEKVQEVRAFIADIAGFNRVTVYNAKKNKGLANSIIQGVTRILENHEATIVLEDDLVTSRNFLDFMNQALDFYKEDASIFSVSGYTMNLPSLTKDKDFYFGIRASSWGWGVTKNVWQEVDWKVQSYSDFFNNREKQKQFNKGGSDLTRMLKAQMDGKIDSWAVRFCYDQFKKNMITVFPTQSKLVSIGFSEDATHTSGVTRFNTPLDTSDKRNFSFKKYQQLDKVITKEFANKFSVYLRLKDFIRRKLSYVA
ncbi:glycosyltransferase [Aquimarina sp. ERC-38]|uniref:glycosyltransferase n=1 Tax=Aquimarina sp. ERC-38 TaxID=2949996 RepID=UPI00224722EC|nr:glycosyltransferase [Aquimarina sp. ERC-38]UZO81461.1 glycosyltransferase [Aquimarina sp. ERC-38]